MSLNPGAGTNVQVNVTVPAGTEVETKNDNTVRTTSQSDGTVQDIATLETTALLDPKLSLEPDREAGGVPGSVVVYEHILSNLSHDRAARELDYHPRPLQETIEDTVSWFQSAGFLP